MEKKLKEDEETTITNEKNITTEDNVEEDDNITEERVENKEMDSNHLDEESFENMEDENNSISKVEETTESNLQEEEKPLPENAKKEKPIFNVEENQLEQTSNKKVEQKVKPIIIPVTKKEEQNTIKSPRDLKVIVQKMVSPRYIEESNLTKKMSMIEMMKNKLQNEAIKSVEKKDNSPVPSEIGNEKGKILKMQNHFIEEIEKQNSPRPSLERKSSKINLEIKREKCNICDKTVYATEKMTAGKNIFHQKCFKCSRCKTKLTIQNYVISNEDEETKLYCKIHYEEGLKSKDIFKKKYTELE
jgi:hypothetical protein